MSEQTTTVTISDLFTAERYSPYQMTKIVNQALAACGIAKSIPPQMLYQYTSAEKRYIATVEIDGRRYVEKDVAVAWTEQYILKQLPKAEQA